MGFQLGGHTAGLREEEGVWGGVEELRAAGLEGEGGK